MYIFFQDWSPNVLGTKKKPGDVNPSVATKANTVDTDNVSNRSPSESEYEDKAKPIKISCLNQ